MPLSRWFDLLQSVQAAVVALDLPELAAANVVVQKVAGDRLRDLPLQRRPAALIAPHAPESIDSVAGTNLRDQVVYPILVTLVARDSADQADQFELFALWRSRVCGAFHGARLEAAGCFKIEVEPLDLVDRAPWAERQLWISRLVLRCFTRELRN